MSYQLAFWSYADGRRSTRVADRRNYAKLLRQRRVDGLAALESDRILDAITVTYPDWRPVSDQSGVGRPRSRSKLPWRSLRLQHPKRGGMDLYCLSDRLIVITFDETKDLSLMNPAIECLEAYGVPLYDPQVDRRFP